MIRCAASRALRAEPDPRRRTVLALWRDGKVPFLEHMDDFAQRTLLCEIVRGALLLGPARFTVFVDDVWGRHHSMALVDDVVSCFESADGAWCVSRSASGKMSVGNVDLHYAYNSKIRIDVMFFAGGRPRARREACLRKLFGAHTEIVVSEYSIPPETVRYDSESEADT